MLRGLPRNFKFTFLRRPRGLTQRYFTPTPVLNSFQQDQETSY